MGEVISGVQNLETEIAEALQNEDPDMVSALLLKVCAAISAPKSAPIYGQENPQPKDGDAIARLQQQSQSRLRKLLCDCMSFLDLTDHSTAIMLQHGLTHIYNMICRFEERTGAHVDQACGGKRWQVIKRALQSVLEGLTRTDGVVGTTAQVAVDDSASCATQRKSPMSQTQWYIPPPKVQSLRYVKQLQEIVLLKCDNCGLELFSKWFFTRGEENKVLRPSHGHTTGDKNQGKASKCGNYRAKDGRASIADALSGITYCEHDRQLKDCALCRQSAQEKWGLAANAA